MLEKRRIEAIAIGGLRTRIKVMVGGAPVTQKFAPDIGADGYASRCGLCSQIGKGGFTVNYEQLKSLALCETYHAAGSWGAIEGDLSFIDRKDLKWRSNRVRRVKRLQWFKPSCKALPSDRDSC
jgi:hypothetical protein